MRINKSDRTRRTREILNRWAGNSREFDHLHGILCMSHGWHLHESIEMSRIVDMGMIASRIDELLKYK